MKHRWPLHPFRTPRLTGTEVSWWRPCVAAVLAILVPAWLAAMFIFNGGPVFSGPPKDGSGYSLGDHAAIVLALVSVSIVVTWFLTPLAVLGIRATAMLGYAGWGTAIVVAWVLGVPMAHLMLNGDLTTEENAVLPHLIVAIAILGLFHWIAFWGLMALRKAPRAEKSELSG